MSISSGEKASSGRYFRGGVEVVKSTQEERGAYLEHLGNIVRMLNGALGNDWWAVGGIARDAILNNNEFVVRHPKGGFRDFDILVRRERIGEIPELVRANETPIPIGLSHHRILWILGDRAEARFGSVRENVPIEAFQTQVACLGDVVLPTLSAQTLLHLYCVGDRPRSRMREKDFINALDLARHIQAHPDDRFPERMYDGFHRFLILRRQKSLNPSRVLFDLAVQYRNSPMNSLLPINHPSILPIVEHVWSFVQSIPLDKEALSDVWRRLARRDKLKEPVSG